MIGLFVLPLFAITLSSKTNRVYPSFRGDGGAIAVEVASIKAVASPQGLRHYPPIVKADSAAQAGVDGPTGTANSSRALMPDHDGIKQRRPSTIQKTYKKIQGSKFVSFFRKVKNQG